MIRSAISVRKTRQNNSVNGYLIEARPFQEQVYYQNVVGLYLYVFDLRLLMYFHLYYC